MVNIKKATPAKAGTAQFTNVATTCKAKFSINELLRTAFYIDIVCDYLFLFATKVGKKIGESLIDGEAYCNLLKKGGNNVCY